MKICRLNALVYTQLLKIRVYLIRIAALGNQMCEKFRLDLKRAIPGYEQMFL